MSMTNWQPFYGVFTDKDGVEHRLEDMMGGGSGAAPVDTLTSTSTTSPLSANMGRILNDQDANIQAQQYALTNRVIALEGLGGYLTGTDFGTATPDQTTITTYAMNNIWPPDGSGHTQTEIFNGTRIVNLFNNHVWVLANTPTSTPAVFEWMDAGIWSVNIVTPTEAGLVRNGLNPGEIEYNAEGVGKVIAFTKEVAVAERSQQNPAVAGNYRGTLSMVSSRLGNFVNATIGGYNVIQCTKEGTYLITLSTNTTVPSSSFTQYWLGDPIHDSYGSFLYTQISKSAMSPGTQSITFIKTIPAGKFLSLLTNSQTSVSSNSVFYPISIIFTEL